MKQQSFELINGLYYIDLLIRCSKKADLINLVEKLTLEIEFAKKNRLIRVIDMRMRKINPEKKAI